MGSELSKSRKRKKETKKLKKQKAKTLPPKITEIQKIENDNSRNTENDNNRFELREDGFEQVQVDDFLEEGAVGGDMGDTYDVAHPLMIKPSVVDPVTIKPEMDDPPTVKPELVIAIDFGTTYSGYAYAYLDSQSKPDIYMNPNWGEEGAASHFKTPTRLCLKDEKLYSFGFKAHTDYINSEYEVGLKLFDHFKMELYKKENIDRNLEIESRDGYKMNAMKVFSIAIEYFKEHCIKKMQDAGRLPEANKILWVLTVPAIWSDSQKMFMREAAIQAGLIKHINDDNLVIALEPESASIYCRSLQIKDVETTGHKYIIVDAGGGTIDVTIYNSLPNGEAQEIHQASGGDWGGNSVNENFKKCLKSLLGTDFLNHLTKEFPSVMFDMMMQFEKAKRGFINSSDLSVPVTVNLGFSDCFEDFKKQSLRKYIEEKNPKGVKIARTTGALQFSTDIIKYLFAPVIEQIIDHIKGLLTLPDVSDIQTIFLVGGFGQCEYLQQQIREAFKETKRVIIPENPVLCVLKGAVLYGCNPDLIRARISPRTYSFLAYKGPNKCVEFISKVIGKGELVRNGHVEHRYCEPNTRFMNSVRMELYASDYEFSEDPKDPDTYKVGSVEIPCPLRDTARLVEFQFIFGGTEIKVKGKNERTGVKGETKINFISGSSMKCKS